MNVGIVNTHANPYLLGPKDDELTISFGIFNSGTHTEEIQIGIVNYCPNNTIPVMIIALSAKAKNQLGNTAERGDRIKKTSRINRR
ncbi:hypothetical protein LEP1GSC163_0492 [Leptospira santarosai str. CBC379]|uniref:Uncharacterized protein n=1 Tax=Leptospira santarosai str. MOR084 TaxID=1049984 RepID=A0A0E2BLB3_9LEPT|nr:hypothetical protein [Leptospira santarosai]EKO32080.1 hypothetical protein LEP1GSC179_0490 [Leptospira santarosai str. MOR084]EKR90375.1 hypothetical protein LEP1GSC163_0492 [Leptospira santarosai str. CBC379]